MACGRLTWLPCVGRVLGEFGCLVCRSFQHDAAVVTARRRDAEPVVVPIFCKRLAGQG